MVRRAILKIERDYAKGVTLTETARILHVSKEYLSALFSRHTGKPFTYYCNALRVNRSLYYLICSDYPIKKIARIVGFSDASYYIRVFREITGRTPGEYRSQSRE